MSTALTVVLGAALALTLGCCGCVGPVLLNHYRVSAEHGADSADGANPAGVAPEEPRTPSAEDSPEGEDEPAPAAPATVAPTLSEEPGGTLAVRYEVTGDGPADIEYVDTRGELVRLTGQRLPWRMTVLTVPSARPTLIASRFGPGWGKVTCRIVTPGRTPVEETTAEGGWGTATCIDS